MKHEIETFLGVRGGKGGGDGKGKRARGGGGYEKARSVDKG